ncbi:MAG TPA: ABC transporter ATP-binding protein [Pseudobacteroides sp.]|uniref:ABC transporter ATP-binding protein n=1 Tax=Pseudobacteroides sp. TaxID=1968840 RepID=UPI002F92A4D2
MQYAIEVSNVTKEINNDGSKFTVLNDISFQVQKGEYISIMGRSGSGKSTLLGILGGLDNVTKGIVKLNGKDISKMDENNLTDFRNENIGIIFQSFNLIPTMNALENVEVPLFFSKKRYNIKKRAAELLEMVGLGDKFKVFPRQLSGGEQQRVAIARALSAEPQILLADEPTGALDSKNGDMVLDILKSFRDKYGMTVVMVTHDQNVAKRTDRILYMEDGKLKGGLSEG